MSRVKCTYIKKKIRWSLKKKKKFEMEERRWFIARPILKRKKKCLKIKIIAQKKKKRKKVGKRFTYYTTID